MCEIIGKYKVVDTRAKKQLGTIVTDNHLEAIWEANRSLKRADISKIIKNQIVKQVKAI